MEHKKLSIRWRRISGQHARQMYPTVGAGAAGVSRKECRSGSCSAAAGAAGERLMVLRIHLRRRPLVHAWQRCPAVGAVAAGAPRMGCRSGRCSAAAGERLQGLRGRSDQRRRDRPWSRGGVERIRDWQMEVQGGRSGAVAIRSYHNTLRTLN
jgi:hypothetical protein